MISTAIRGLLFWAGVAYWLGAVALQVIIHPSTARDIFSNEPDFNI